MHNRSYHQRGSTLFVTLIMLALLMILSTSTINGSMVELRAASNTAQVFAGFQRAEAGVSATMGLVNTANNPFNSTSVGDPFASMSPSAHPLVNVNNVAVSVALEQPAGTCSRAEQASSASQIACEYYEVDSAHSVTASATTTLRQGVSREVIAN